MSRLDQAVGGQRWRLATLDDRADKVWREEGEIDEMSNATLRDGRTAGFHLSSLYSPVGWFSWSDAAEMYEQAKKTPDLMKGFVNTVLGLPFEEEAKALKAQRDSAVARVSYDGRSVAGTFATAGSGAETFAAGDRLAIINQDPADATLADLSITFLGKRT
jgi:hypothetical protein